MAILRSPRLSALAFGLVVASCAAAASAQTIGYNARTGDVWVDSRLVEINDYGRRFRDPFIDEMHGHYGAPRPLLVDLLDRRDWAPGDVYFACAMAQALGMPCIDVAREYDRHPGQGWGAVAKRLGIKPGSDAFHALKRGQVDTYRRWGHAVVIDRPVRIDWSSSGPRRGNGAKGKVDTGRQQAHDRPRAGKASATGNRGQGNNNKGNAGRGNSDRGNSGGNRGNGRGG